MTNSGFTIWCWLVWYIAHYSSLISLIFLLLFDEKFHTRFRFEFLLLLLVFFYTFILLYFLQRQFYILCSGCFIFCAAALLYFVQRQSYIFYRGSFTFCAVAVLYFVHRQFYILCSGSFEKLDPLPARTLSFNLGFKLTSHGSEDRVSPPTTLLYWQLYFVIYIQLYTQWIQNMYDDICMRCPSPYNAAFHMLLECIQCH